MTKYLIILLTVILPIANRNIAAGSETSATQINPLTLFNGERAMVDLVKQVDAGPRLPDSPGLKATREQITTTLSQGGFEVGKQNFTVHSPLLGYEVSGQNIFGVYPKGATVKYMISAHYDTRPYADQDPDLNLRRQPVPGANDGASGVAVLLELARALPQANSKHGVALVFFDMEDHGDSGSAGGFCLGSREFAKALPKAVKDYQFGINLDMVGDAELELKMEGYSLAKAPRLTFDLWRTGKSLYPEVWKEEKGMSIYDDHLSFVALGRPYIDVIDFDYKPWHTTQDLPARCSAQSLDIIGDTILTFILN